MPGNFIVALDVQPGVMPGYTTVIASDNSIYSYRYIGGTDGRTAMLADCPYTAGVPGSGTPSVLKSTARVCAGGLFVDFPATGNEGISTALPNFLGIKGRDFGLNGQPFKRLVGADANCVTDVGVDSQYCH